MELKKIESVIFDLDNTLYDEEKFYYQYFKIFCKKFNFSFNKFIKSFDIKKEIFKVNILKKALIKIGKFNHINHEKSFKLLIDFNCKIKLFNGAKQTLNFLKKNKIKIGILTNGSVKIQKKKIKVLNIKNKIDKIVYAGNFKRQKPFSQSFIKILNVLKAKSINSIFIGDNYNTDIIGAKKIKMYTIMYSSKKRVKNNKNIDKVAKNFFEIKKILKKLIVDNSK